MPEKAQFRRAIPEETDLLRDMTLEGVKYWGHHLTHPQLIEEFGRNELPTADYIRNSPVYVMEERERPIGFFGLTLKEDEQYVDLHYLFLDTSYIGQGYGKKLWQEALLRAGQYGFDRLRILSDPGALGFYEAMGAVLEKDVELRPGFALGLYWYDLAAVRPA